MNTPAPLRRTSALAIISLVCGILGWVALPFIASVVAIVTGHMARTEIRRDPSMDGDGMAVAGLVLGWVMVGIGLAVLAFVAVIVVLSCLWG